MKHILILLFLNISIFAETSLLTIDPVMLYQEAMQVGSVEDQSSLLNRALTGFLDQKPQNPSAVWHFDIASCFLALHTPGPAIFHFLEAKRIDPGLARVDEGLTRARQEAHLPFEVRELRPWWVFPWLSKTAIEIFFLVGCLSAFFVASLGLFLRYSLLVTVAKWMSFFVLTIGVIVVLRVLEPLDGVVIYPEKLQKEASGGDLQRAMLPGEQVQVVDIEGGMIQVVTLDGQMGWISNKTCWILSAN